MKSEKNVNDPLSRNLLERIQTKIVEKGMKSDMGFTGAKSALINQNHRSLDQKRRSEASIGPKRCPNLQQLIERKQERERTMREKRTSQSR